jgi:hypothetical protein
LEGALQGLSDGLRGSETELPYPTSGLSAVGAPQEIAYFRLSTPTRSLF